MSNPVCSATTFNTNASCYDLGVLNPAQQWALLVYFKVLELAAIGGTDYTAALKTTLQTDTACPPISEPEIMAAQVNVAYNNASAAGASMPATVSAALTLSACLQYVPGGVPRLERINLLLDCKLGKHASYPQ
jgi:hypothetical protein